MLLLGGAGFAFNWARFRSFGEFGHIYLNVRWTDRIQRYGLFNFAFLARNLTCAFMLTPKLLAKAPYLQLSWHGMSLLITTPALPLSACGRASRSSLHTALWCVVRPSHCSGFMYQNDGWVQFGYRFSNRLLVRASSCCSAIGGRPLTRTWKALILVGIVVNLFGAITFGRALAVLFDGFFPISQNEL